MKSSAIYFRIETEKKNRWVENCRKRNTSLTDYIIGSVDGRFVKSERIQILAFLEKQDNFFVKVQTNINQFAKIANTEKTVSKELLTAFRGELDEVIRLKMEQNKMFSQIYRLLAIQRK